jgi:hypothetical protein
MVELRPSGGGGGNGSDGEDPYSPVDNLPDFSLSSPDLTFEPQYYPERVKPSKARNLEREPNLCDGEEVTDIGGKNADLHVRGYLLDFEKSTFWDVLDHGEKFEFVSMPWSGFVYVKSGKLEGPKGLDNQHRDWVYEYTMKLVSAGEDNSSTSGGVSFGFDHNGEGYGF